MDTQEQKNDNNPLQNDTTPPRYSGRIWGGLFLLFLGAVFLMREMRLAFFPDWLFTWPMILIAVGVFSGIKHGFRGGGWVVLLLVGGFFLLDQVDPGFNIRRYIVPFVIICVGLGMISRPRWGKHGKDCYRGKRDWHRRYNYNRDWNSWNPENQYSGSGSQQASQTPPQQDSFSSGPTPPPPPPPGDTSADDYIDSMSVFGGVRKVIVSKNFRGGEATSFMGGTELDFTQADIHGTVVLELTQVMGGAKLIVPSHWTIRNEVNAVLGGVDDKRQVNATPDPTKILVLKGTAFLGGLEIRNY